MNARLDDGANPWRPWVGVFAVFHTAQSPAGGTAFQVGDGLFLTARHVLRTSAPRARPEVFVTSCVLRDDIGNELVCSFSLAESSAASDVALLRLISRGNVVDRAEKSKLVLCKMPQSRVGSFFATGIDPQPAERVGAWSYIHATGKPLRGLGAKTSFLQLATSNWAEGLSGSPVSFLEDGPSIPVFAVGSMFDAARRSSLVGVLEWTAIPGLDERTLELADPTEHLPAELRKEERITQLAARFLPTLFVLSITVLAVFGIAAVSSARQSFGGLGGNLTVVALCAFLSLCSAVITALGLAVIAWAERTWSDSEEAEDDR